MDLAVCLHLLDEMGRGEFQEKLVKTVMKTPAFVKLMSSGIETLNDSDKKALCEALEWAELPVLYEQGSDLMDHTLAKVAWAISNRAVNVR